MNYRSIKGLELEATCVGISQYEWDKLMEGAVKADKMKINKLIKKYLPDLFHKLMFDTVSLKKLMQWNPYDYYRTKTHLIMVWSGIEYFIKIKS